MITGKRGEPEVPGMEHLVETHIHHDAHHFASLFIASGVPL